MLCGKIVAAELNPYCEQKAPYLKLDVFLHSDGRVKCNHLMPVTVLYVGLKRVEDTKEIQLFKTSCVHSIGRSHLT